MKHIKMWQTISLWLSTNKTFSIDLYVQMYITCIWGEHSTMYAYHCLPLGSGTSCTYSWANVPSHATVMLLLLIWISARGKPTSVSGVPTHNPNCTHWRYYHFAFFLRITTQSHADILQAISSRFKPWKTNRSGDMDMEHIWYRYEAYMQGHAFQWAADCPVIALMTCDDRGEGQ